MIEDLEHKFIECAYVRKIWQETFKYTSKLTPVNIWDGALLINKIMGVTNSISPLVLGIHSEILKRLMSLKPDQNYLVLPKIFVKWAIKRIRDSENNHELQSKSMIY